jgi:hypothetical protein
MKKFLAVFLAFSILALFGELHSKERKGAELLVHKTNGELVQGELIVVKERSLLLKESETGADVTVGVEELETIRIVKPSKFWQGAGLGFLASSLTLGGIAWATDEEYFTDPEGGGPLILMLFFGIPGFLLGGIVGAIVGTDKTIEISGKTGPEIEEALEYLRSRARVPDYQ